MKAAYIGIDLLYPALRALRETGAEILKIFTCETDNRTEFNTEICRDAETHGTPLQKTRIREADLIALREAGCEMVLCGGYYYKIPIVEGMKMINIHPALLPIGRGAWPMAVTILKGLRESGVTIHKMTAELDAGDILLQEKIEVGPRETLQSLTDKQRAAVPGMVRKLCTEPERIWENARPQGEYFEYWPCPTEEDWTITEDMEIEEIDRRLRAFYGYEVILRKGGEDWEIIGAGIGPNAEPGKTAIPFAGQIISAGQARRI